MSKPYDAATKALIEQRPEDWLVLAGLRARGAVRVMDADLSTVTSLADKVIWVEDDPAWLLEIELQSSRDVDLPIRLFRYNALLTAAYRLLTRSVVVLLRQLADGPELTGRLTFPGSQDFRYDVIRVWEVPVGRFLDEGLGVLPLAPLADLGRHSPEDVLNRLGNRLRNEASPAVAETLWSATWVLLGLRYKGKQASDLMRGVREMKESATYQMAVKEGLRKGLRQGRVEGRVEGLVNEAREFVLRLGRKWLGEPDAATLAILSGLNDRERLEQIGERLRDARTWADALGDLAVGPDAQALSQDERK